MQACKFTITTSVDGKETTVIRAGKIDVDDTMAVLTYTEENSRVCITLQRGVAIIDRQGDYSLRLQLEQGKLCEGSIGLGGSAGNVPVRTHRVKYFCERRIFKLSLRYDLIFSEDEVQKMQLNLRGQIKE